MARTTQQIAITSLFTIAVALTGCQTSIVPTDKSSPLAAAAAQRGSSPGEPVARTSAFQYPAPATIELVNASNAAEKARAITEDNISNADTTAYRATRARCQYRGRLSCQIDFTQGSLEKTGRPLDVGIQGQGLFAIKLLPSVGNGIGYTRNGNFVVNKLGELVLNLGDGYMLIPPITVPTNTTDITIGVDGTISVLLAGANAKQTVGQLHLTQFVNPHGLGFQSGSIFTESEASGPPTQYSPGDGGTGQILQAYLETSNVDVINERSRLRFLDNWLAMLRQVAGERD